MTSTILRGYTQAAFNVLSTELNALGNNTDSGVSGSFSNATNLDLVMDFVCFCNTQGVARTGTPTITLYYLPSVDGTNFDAAISTGAIVAATFTFDTSVTARYRSSLGFQIIPGSAKFIARNATGQTLAATGTTIMARTRSLTNG